MGVNTVSLRVAIFPKGADGEKIKLFQTQEDKNGEWLADMLHSDF